MWRSLRVTNQLENPSEYGSLALSFIGGVYFGARALHVLTLIWFGCIARLSQWGAEGGNFLVQIISACLRYVKGWRGRGSSALCGRSLFVTIFCCCRLTD
jgi:hypothetical protein